MVIAAMRFQVFMAVEVVVTFPMNLPLPSPGKIRYSECGIHAFLQNFTNHAVYSTVSQTIKTLQAFDTQLLLRQDGQQASYCVSS